MYIVIDKETKTKLWCNPAPKSQNLKGKEVWFLYDSEKHIIICDHDEDIELGYFDIEDNVIVKWDLQRKITESVIQSSKEIDEQFSDGEIDVIEYNNLKMKKLRLVRDGLINETIWIMQRHNGEKEGIEKGITENSSTLTEEQYNSWLLYWEYLRDVPVTIDVNTLKYSEITENILPEQPQ